MTVEIWPFSVRNLMRSAFRYLAIFFKYLFTVLFNDCVSDSEFGTASGRVSEQ
jgi:hypothetical protein